MKKHIIGLTLFSFIVSAIAIFYGTFSCSERTLIAPRYASAERTYCKFKQKADNSEFDKLSIEQATINLQTKEFRWELSSPETNAFYRLHFFSKESNETRYLVSSPIIENSEVKLLKINKAFKFLYEKNSYANLYVIAEFESEQTYNKNNPPKFDMNKATPVTFYRGENY